MADQPAPPRRLWRIVLIASLALNLAVLGIVAGSFLRDGRPGPPRGFDFAAGPVAAALNPQDRRAIARALRRDRSLRAGDGRAAVLEEVVRQLRSDPLDQDALAAALQAPGDRMRRLQAAATDALLAQIIAMTPQDRADFADRLADGINARGGRDR